MTGAEICKRFNSLEGNARGNWMNLWQECADWSLPTNDNINRIRVEGQEKSPQRMIDTCIEANFNFASGFFSHMFPPNTVWAKFRHPNPQMMSKPGVADYFERASRVAHQLLIGSNFAQEEFQALLAMGAFGTNTLSMEEDDRDIVKFRSFIVSNLVMDMNHRGEIDVVGRKFKLDARQAIQQFGEEALAKAKLEYFSDPAIQMKETKYEFIHLVTPRGDYDKSKKDSKNKPWASYYVCEMNKEIVKESGFEYNPYKVGRFTVGNDEVYGRGPMSSVLGTARRTNVIYRSMNISAEQHSNPQWLVPDDDSVKGISGRAGALIKWRAQNPNGRPERLAPNGDPNIAHEMYVLHDTQIKRMFFNHLFRPLEDYRNMTATEVNERMTTDMMTIAPFVSRYQDEHVSPIMENLYYIMQKRNMLPPMPAALQEDPSFEIEYVGRLSLATKNFETLGAVNTLRIFGELSQMNPQMAQSMDNVDPDKLFKEIWYAQSSSMNALKPEDEVEAQREAQAQAMAQQQQVENMPKVADSVQKLSGAVDPSSVVAQQSE